MVEVHTLAPGGPEELAAAHRLADAALAADGHPSVGDAVWRDLEHPARSGLGLLAIDGGTSVGYLHAAADGGTVERATTISLVVHPAHRGAGVGEALVQRAVESLAGPAGAPNHLQLWIFGAGDGADQFASRVGFTRERELRQMRVPLPLAAEPSPRWPEGVTVRSFEPGRDEQAWLEVNNRSFAADPDQSGWDETMLRERMEEGWFDPAGFLLAFDGRALAGFCWTKVHPADAREPEPLGEIYVIGADPDRQGAGLGRSLVVAGLASLSARGVHTGMLFVDAANEPAVRLYEKLGFTTARVDRAYGRSA
jgi:mycothiol synthase